MLDDFGHQKARRLSRAGIVEWPRDDNGELPRVNCRHLLGGMFAHGVMAPRRKCAVFGKWACTVRNRINLRAAGDDDDPGLDICSAESCEQVGGSDDMCRIHLTDVAVSR